MSVCFRILSAVVAIGISSPLSALMLSNQNCFKNNLNRNLTEISDYPENNTGPLDDARAQGWEDHDIKMARNNIGRLYCPGTLHKNGGDLQATLIGAEDQVVTNEHAFIDEKGLIRDPLSKCKLNFPAHTGGDATTEYDLALEDGKKGLEQAEARGLLRWEDTMI